MHKHTQTHTMPFDYTNVDVPKINGVLHMISNRDMAILFYLFICSCFYYLLYADPFHLWAVEGHW